MSARILVVAPDLPHPPFTGAHTRPLSLIEALARRHEVVAVGAAGTDADLSELERMCISVERLAAEPYKAGPLRAVLSAARRGITPVPFIAQSRSAALADMVAAAAARYKPDAVQLETMYAVHYRRPDLPAVIDLPDVVSGLCDAAAQARPARYLAARPQGYAAARAERRLLATFAAVLTINEADAARLRSLALNSAMVPLAMAVPSAAEIAGQSSPAEDGAEQAQAEDAAERAQAELVLLFVGSFRHQPNREAAAFIAKRLVPAISDRGLRCRVTIAGRGARAHGLGAGTPRRVGPVTLAYVSDPPHLAPLYREADVVIVPLAHGGGTKNKTLEAMAWGRCVMGTEQAFTGLPVRLRDKAFVQAPLNAAEMAETLARLMEDPGGRGRLGRAAREHIMKCHSQTDVNRLVDQVYERVLSRTTPFG